jgi:hypothetical protein
VLGVTRFGLARYGKVWVSWSGLARQGVARLSLEWYGFRGDAGCG